MAPVLYPPARPQSIGEVLDGAFRIFRATLFGCLPLGILGLIAGQLPNIYDIARGRPLRQFGGLDSTWWGLDVIGGLLAIGFTIAIVSRQAALAAGQRPTYRASLAVGLRKLPICIGVGILLVVATGIWFVPTALLPRPYLLWGAVVLSIPASYVAVALSLSFFAVLVGDQGIRSSLLHSLQLVRGNWWRVATIYTVAIAMLAVFYTLAGVIAAFLIPLVGTTDLVLFTALSAVLAAALGAVGTPFYTAIGLALYGDLEARRQGRDLERRIAALSPG